MGDYVYYILFGLIAVIIIVLCAVIYTIAGMRRNLTGEKAVKISPNPFRTGEHYETVSQEPAEAVVAAITAAIYTILASEMPAGEQPLFLVRSIRRFK